MKDVNYIFFFSSMDFIYHSPALICCGPGEADGGGEG